MKTSKRNAVKRIVITLEKDREEVKRKSVRVLPANKGKVLAVIALTGLTIGTTACGGFHASLCTTEGCRARNDYATGIISETRTPAGQKSAHYQLREQQAKQTWLGYFRDMIKGGRHE